MQPTAGTRHSAYLATHALQTELIFLAQKVQIVDVKKKCSLTLFDLSVIVGALWSNLSCKYSWVCHEREEITVRKITKFLFHCLFCYLIKSYNIQKLTCDP